MKKLIVTERFDLSKQLDLGKEIVANLSEEELREVEGGAGTDTQYSCFYLTCNGGPVREATEG